MTPLLLLEYSFWRITLTYSCYQTKLREWVNRDAMCRLQIFIAKETWSVPYNYIHSIFSELLLLPICDFTVILTLLNSGAESVPPCLMEMK